MLPTLIYWYNNGLPPWAPDPWLLIKIFLVLAFFGILKRYTMGANNLSERDMHGKIVILTGGTSGIGAQVARQLAKRGAQLVLLTQLPPSDPFLAEYIGDLRDESDNQLIYAEQVDLASLHSIRKFATKWVDNAPPRRLDMIILCAATLTPPGSARVDTNTEGGGEGVESTWMVNYLANFHLLSILSPALRAQPFDRDVRIIFATCSSYIAAPSLSREQQSSGGKDVAEQKWSASEAYASSKMALMVFAQAFQKHLDAYKRPDGLPTSTKVVVVNPGFCRTPGMRRTLTRGSLWGLGLYLSLYGAVWMFLKSPNMGAQSILWAAMDGTIIRDAGGKLIKECMEVDYARRDVKDEELAKKLWESSDKLIEEVEKSNATFRARQKKEQEKLEKQNAAKAAAGKAEKQNGKTVSLDDASKKNKAGGSQEQTPNTRLRKKVQFDGKAID